MNEDFVRMLHERHAQVMARFDGIEEKTDENTAAIVELKTDLKWILRIAGGISACVGAVVSFVASRIFHMDS